MDTALNVTTLASRRRTVDVANKPAWSIGVAPITGIDGQKYIPHPNGGGLVSTNASVALTVFIASTARVGGRALIEGSVRLLNNAIVEDDAVVIGKCVLRHNSRVSDSATLIGHVVLLNHAHIHGDAYIEGTIVVEELADIGRDNRIVGHHRVS